DEAALEKVKSGTPPILEDLAKRHKVANPEFTLWHAQGLLALGYPGKAGELLATEKEPKADDPNLKFFCAGQLLHFQVLRQQGVAAGGPPEGAANLAQADRELSDILGTEEKPNWGSSNVDALKERVQLYADQEKFSDGYYLAASLVKKLAEPASKGGP